MEKCVEYFKKYTVYDKLFRGFREKYRTLGRVSGTVVLKNLTPQEKQQLEGFFFRDFSQDEEVRISASDMKKMLAKSRFGEVELESLVESYFGETLISRKEQRKIKQDAQQLYFQNCFRNLREGYGKEWLLFVYNEKKAGYALLIRRYREAPEKAKELLEQAQKAIDTLPVRTGKKLPVPVFAASVNGNPHSLDPGTVLECLLDYYLKECMKSEKEREYDTELEQKTRRFYEAGLLKDDVSNDVLVYGIRGRLKDGTYHPGMEGFLHMKEPMKLTLMTLFRLHKIESQKPGEPIEIVENPAVFSRKIQENPHAPVICGNGQLRIAVLTLLDLCDPSLTFIYEGDYDPEGLLIAQRLKDRYQDRIVFENYSLDNYISHLSDVELDEKRLKKLEHVTDSRLQDVKEEMKKQKKAAYQETWGQVCVPHGGTQTCPHCNSYDSCV